MNVRIGLAQNGYPQKTSVANQIESFAVRAQDAGVHLLVFPENLMSPRELSVPELIALAEPLDGPFVQAACASAKRQGLWMVITMMERRGEGDLPFNTAVVIDDAGVVRATYRKCHLYDAHSVRESDRMGRGDALCPPVEALFGTFGVGICYDLRFPEMARSLALGGSELIVFPSAWHDGPNKYEHWRTLLRARAIENECYVAGVCHAASRYVGHSMIIGPLGDVLAEGPAVSEQSDCEALVVADLNQEAIQSARSAMPIFSHRRPELYGPLC